MRKFLIPAFLVLIVSSITVLNGRPDLRGRMMAHYDLARGHERLLRYGLLPEGEQEYARLYMERYGVELRRVAGCMVTSDLMKYAEGYNEVSYDAVLRRVGRDPLIRLNEEFERTWVRTEAASQRKSVPEYLLSQGAGKRNAACFKELVRGMSMYSVAERCGVPDEEVGYKTFTFLYHEPDGSVISIEAPCARRIEGVFRTDRSGQRTALVGPTKEWQHARQLDSLQLPILEMKHLSAPCDRVAGVRPGPH